MQQPGLPTDVSSFIGRRADRQQVRSLLADARIVTLTGVGGVGKTRLALRVAGELRRAFADGVVFVTLAHHHDPDAITDAIATSLGLQGRSNRPTITTLVDYLSSRSTLIVLDNCEHLIDGAAVVADTLIRTCADLRILVTSREPLRIEGEAVHVVAPLNVPPPDTQEPLQQFEGVSLFVDRARAGVPDFEITADNRAAVADIVVKLEGLPLAIELAASRLRAMSPDDIARNLTERWDLLSRGSRAAPDRQRTMAACIEWSFDLCTAAERQAWGRLSVFSDGFELDAAAAVCGSLGHPLPDIVAELVDKSILTATPVADTTRYRMLPPIRHRGLVHLRESDELITMRRRHRAWCVNLTSQVAEQWMSPRQVEALERIRRELGNLNSCLEFCSTEPGEADAGLAMGADLLEFGTADGGFRQGRAWFDRLLPLSSGSSELRARALRTAGWWATMQGDVRTAADLTSEGASIAASLGGHTEVLLTQAEGWVAMFSGNTDLAREKFDQALDGLAQYGDTGQLAFTYIFAALNHCFRGDVDAALEAHRECMALTEPVGESWFRSYSLWIAGLAMWASGSVADGVTLQKESLRLSQQTRDPLKIGTSVEALAWMCVHDDPERSARLLGAAREIWDRIETSTEALPGLHEFHLRCASAARERLGDEAYQALFAAGKQLHRADVIAEALQEPGASTPTRRMRKPSSKKAGGSVLTPRETQIAKLVADGMSNKDIAASLVISKRTAETHVEHILTKLGFTNRNQIAAWVTEQAGVGSSSG